MRFRSFFSKFHPLSVDVFIIKSKKPNLKAYGRALMPKSGSSAFFAIGTFCRININRRHIIA